MKKNIKKIIITSILTIAAMLLNFQGNNENNSFIGFETVQAEKDGISFCVHGGTKCCYPISVGFACGEGPWLDCRGTWIM